MKQDLAKRLRLKPYSGDHRLFRPWQGRVAPQRAVFTLFSVLLVTLLVAGGRGVVQAAPASPIAGADYHPVINPAEFGKTVDNPYFPLTPGTTFVFEGHLDKDTVRNDITVTHDTKRILGIDCVVVRDKVTTNGELSEDTYDWYAQDKAGNVWYMGEDTRTYAGGKITGTKGTWEAGVDGAKPGIVMQAHPVVGDPYRQEYYAGKAEDVAQVATVRQAATVKAGAYTGVVITHEWDALKPDAVENKAYAPGVGNISNDSPSENEHTELISVTVETP